MSDVSVIIIGAGFGGLATAIELAQRNIRVQLFESYHDVRTHGDVIKIASNAARVIGGWGDLLPKLKAISANPEIAFIKDEHGKTMLTQPLPAEFDGYPELFCNRGRTLEMMYEYAIKLGVTVQFDTKVSEVFEDVESAGVYIGDKKYVADLVVAADGVHSRVRHLVTGKHERPQKSGYAVFRSWFSMKSLLEDPLTKPLGESTEDSLTVWIGKDCHAILVTDIHLQAISLSITHKDIHDIEENWNLRGDRDDMLAAVKGWDPVLQSLANQIPPEVLTDFKMLWRDPIDTWVSKHGRICLVGDSAHPHLASSAQGSAQAIEDSATIGHLVGRLGKEKGEAFALRAYARLRFERTSLTQRMGWETRHAWHQTDWEAVSQNPKILSIPIPLWIHNFDAESYTSDNFDAVLVHLKTGAPFKSTNLPPGYEHESWTVETMLAREGQKADASFYKVRNYLEEPAVQANPGPVPVVA